jgi:hypothetical protein
MTDPNPNPLGDQYRACRHKVQELERTLSVWRAAEKCAKADLEIKRLEEQLVVAHEAWDAAWLAIYQADCRGAAELREHLKRATCNSSGVK